MGLQAANTEVLANLNLELKKEKKKPLIFVVIPALANEIDYCSIASKIN